MISENVRQAWAAMGRDCASAPATLDDAIELLRWVGARAGGEGILTIYPTWYAASVRRWKNCTECELCAGHDIETVLNFERAEDGVAAIYEVVDKTIEKWPEAFV